jgi:hypothetical protein
MVFVLDEFLKEQLLQYNVGKRHLANMMGEDPDTFTQEDVDVSVLKRVYNMLMYIHCNSCTVVM